MFNPILNTIFYNSFLKPMILVSGHIQILSQRKKLNIFLDYILNQ